MCLWRFRDHTMVTPAPYCTASCQFSQPLVLCRTHKPTYLYINGREQAGQVEQAALKHSHADALHACDADE